jgi:anti-sigma factor RsiW
MDHNEAVQQMATERYLLGELSPELRDAFEEHFFDCQECAMDLRAASVFLEEAKVHLPELTGPLATPAAERPAAIHEKKQVGKKAPWWSSLLRPAFAAPVFATLLAVVGYQNLVTFPALRASSSEPMLSPMVYLHAGTRGGQGTPVDVDAKHGIALVVDKPQQAGYSSFVFELRDPQGKVTASIAAPNDGVLPEGQPTDGTLSLAIPGAALRDGAYTLAISGVASNGSRTEIERHILNFHLRN